MFNRLTPEGFKLVSVHAGPQTARWALRLIVGAAMCAALYAIVWFIWALAAGFVLPVLAVIPRLPMPQTMGVLLSVLLTVIIVAVAGYVLRRTIMRGQHAIIEYVARHNVSSVVRMAYLEENAASLHSTRGAIADLQRRTATLEVRTGQVKPASAQAALVALMASGPSVVPVGPLLLIHSARYGVSEDDSADVTDVVTSFIEDNRLRMRATNKDLGSDPCPGRRKHLRVSFQVGSSLPQEVVVDEGEELRLG